MWDIKGTKTLWLVIGMTIAVILIAVLQTLLIMKMLV